MDEFVLVGILLSILNWSKFKQLIRVYQAQNLPNIMDKVILGNSFSVNLPDQNMLALPTDFHYHTLPQIVPNVSLISQSTRLHQGSNQKPNLENFGT